MQMRPLRARASENTMAFREKAAVNTSIIASLRECFGCKGLCEGEEMLARWEKGNKVAWKFLPKCGCTRDIRSIQRSIVWKVYLLLMKYWGDVERVLFFAFEI